VPLKTYLPDGDIDLTALAEPNSEHSLPEVVCGFLQMEEKHPCSMYEVKDVQLILAEVCTVILFLIVIFILESSVILEQQWKYFFFNGRVCHEGSQHYC
jgi:hypothetical protein